MADALLSPEVGATMWVASTGAAVYAAKKITKSEWSDKKLPIMAVSGAFVFAAQMINFTIPGTGSSGHIGGGILLAGLLGEFPAFLTLAAVLLIQCLFFADGGLLAWGANVFNMGVLPCLIVYPLLVRPLLKRKMTKKRLTGTSIAGAVVGLQLGALAVVVETQLSNITKLPFSTFVSLMQPIHLAIGLVEGVATAAVLLFVWNMRPEWLQDSIQTDEFTYENHTKKMPVKRMVILFAAAALVTAGILSLMASSYPDGLEWSMEHTAGTTELTVSGNKIYDFMASIQNKFSFLPDYDFADGMGKGTSLSGIVGVILTALLAFGMGGLITWIKRRKRR